MIGSRRIKRHRLEVGQLWTSRTHVSAVARDSSARKRESRSTTNFDDRQMLATFDVAHRELDLFNVARGSTRSMRPSRPRLNSPPNRRATIVDILRRLPGKPHVGTPPVVPRRIEEQFAAHRFQRHRNKNETRALALHRSDEPFDNGDARGFPDAPVARPNPATFAPCLEAVAPELFALVRDDMAGMLAVCASGSVEESLHLDRRGTLRKDGESHADPGQLIDRHGNPPAERPSLRHREGKPRHPESSTSRYGREVDVPRIPWILGNDSSSPSLGLRFIFERSTLFPDDAADSRRTKVEPDPSEYLRHALGAHRWEKSSHLMDKVPDKVWVTVDRLDSLYQVPFSLFVQSAHPDLQRLQVHEENPSRFLQGPPAGRTELEDSHPLCRSVMGAAARVGPFPTAIFDRQLLAKEGYLAGCLLELGSEPSLASRPTACAGDGDAGQRDGVEHARLDVLRLLFRESDRSLTGHGKLRLRWGDPGA